MRMLAHRIADPRVLRLIERWLEAGVLESGQWKAVEAGTPQGSGISPILANVFLHYVVDLWVRQWRRRRAAGQVIVCRYADDMVFGCQFEVGSGAARLAAIPAGESPANTRSPVHVVVIPSGRAGDQSAGSLEVKALWGRETGSIRQRGASNLAGRNVSKPGSPERRAPREADCGNFGSAEPLRSRRRPCRHRTTGP